MKDSLCAPKKSVRTVCTGVVLWAPLSYIIHMGCKQKPPRGASWAMPNEVANSATTVRQQLSSLQRMRYGRQTDTRKKEAVPQAWSGKPAILPKTTRGDRLEKEGAWGCQRRSEHVPGTSMPTTSSPRQTLSYKPTCWYQSLFD